ncbi:MAG: 50S ribosomal protein L10 [Oscillospiraceae bacterium]|nr:50S ribosomal protein L10 [Oscillospiraceae bacterium]
MPNPTVLKQKQEFVAELSEKLKNSGAGVLVDYRGISVDDDTKLRRELRAGGVEYTVVKNTLLKRAFENVGFDEMCPQLKEMSALAIGGEDQIAPAKILSGYAKKANGKFKIKAGYVDGRVISAEDVTALAELPSRETLIAQMLGGLNAPISGLVNVLNGNIRGLVVALNAIAEQKA